MFIKSNNDQTKKPAVFYAATVIFLEFFAFGLLTTPMITILDQTFPKHTFLINGIIQGIRGIFAFIGAPVIGLLSDVFGRKPFLLLTVTFTCFPIPFIKISQFWYFIIYCITGIFAVTFTVILAYVADITNEKTRNTAYGKVSATFAASLVISPAIGAYLGRLYSETFVVSLATIISIIDVIFIFVYLPESLPKNLRKTFTEVFHCGLLSKIINFICRRRQTEDDFVPNNHPNTQTSRDYEAGSKLKAQDPFSLRKDKFTLLVCLTTFLSYLPEAGQYSCFIVYLKLLMNFSEESLAKFIAFLGLTSCLAQTVLLTFFIRIFGHKQTIILGLLFEAGQLALYGFGNSIICIWIAGGVAAMGTITYPALSAFLSHHVSADVQGVAQGFITGIRGLCSGLGPALFGLIFYLFNVDLNETSQIEKNSNFLFNLDSEELNKFILDQGFNSQMNSSVHNLIKETWLHALHKSMLPGPPFAIGSIIVLFAVLVAYFIPDSTDVKYPDSPDISIKKIMAIVNKIKRNSYSYLHRKKDNFELLSRDEIKNSKMTSFDNSDTEEQDIVEIRNHQSFPKSSSKRSFGSVAYSRLQNNISEDERDSPESIHKY